MSDLRAQLQSALGGAYSIERELGGGGMSRVFLATETALGREVVVKMLTPALAADLSADRFAREVRLAARLQQANIVPLLSAGEANGLPWYSMPFVRGQSLRAKLASGEAIPLTDAVHILRDVARALAFAHGEGIVHRDIKPENILLSGGAAVVTDFGIAKALTASRTQEGIGSATITQTGTSIGTPAYIAPEQAAGDPKTDHRADIYAWGVVAWELIAGKHPFADRTSPSALIAAHLAETPRPVTVARPDTPATLGALVARCLEKDPARRPQSAGELLTALDQIGTPSGERGSVSMPRRWSSGALAAAAGVVAVLALGAWFATHRSGGSTAAGSGPKSIAVLPFESVGGDTANVYFSEGMADELTTALAKVSGLRVAATSSAFSYRNKAADVREVGKALNVGAVLQGRVRREGTRMRVSAQLTSAADGIVLWSNSYEREVKDAFAVQDEITRDIVGALRVTLAGGSGSAAGKLSTDTTDAATHDLYLRGLYFLGQRAGGVARSIPYFQQALARDSTFAPAWAALGNAYAVLPLYSPVPIDSVLEPARRAIANALRFDSTNAAAYGAEGMFRLLSVQPREAMSAFEHAFALDSSNVQAARAYWGALALSGRVDESVRQIRRATRIDPLSPTTYWVAAIVMLNARRQDSALAMARRAVELDTAVSGVAHLAYALTLFTAGKVDSARRMLAGAAHVPQDSPWLGYLLAATGDRAGAAAYLQQLDAERGHSAFANTARAWTYLGGGDTTRALDALDAALRAHEPFAFSAPLGMPEYDPIRHSARFAAVIKGYGLDPAEFGASIGAVR
ncbi:MAG TPA: protein kinase [Gemmatimonadaceae bacterium]|nr:protein kinase [Gemmatimonadaceae bacterium]